MNLIPHWAWLQGLRRSRADGAPDPADMGTAFGLDACFADAAPHPQPTGPGGLPTAPPPRSERTGLPRSP